MPPEASGPVFTVRKPIFIGPLWARRIAGAATSALAPSMAFKTVRRWTVMAPPFGLDLCGWVSPIARFLIKLDIILTYRNQFCPARRAPSAARRRLISCKDCDVSCGISSPVASPMTPSDSQVPGFDLVVGPKLFRTRGIDHLALTHHVHVIDQLERERGVLFDQQNRMAFLLQPRDCLPQPLDDDGREPLGRLVHDQAIGVGHEPAADGQHLLLAARERPGALAASFAQAGEQRIDAFHVPAATVDATLGDHEVLLDAERGKDASPLRHEAHPAAHRLERRNLGNVHALEENLSTPRTIETHDRVHQCGLADAIASEQPKDLPLLELQGQALEDVSVPVIRVNVLNFQDRHGSGGPEIDLLHLLTAADLLPRSRLQHLAEMEDGNMLGDVEYHVHIVLDEKDGEVAIEVGEKAYHLRGLARRQPGGRFIQKQDLRVAGEAEDDFELSLLAVR